MATQVDFALHNSGFCSSHRRNKYSIFVSVQLCWPRNGIYYHIVGMGTVGFFYLPLMLRAVLIVSIDKSTAAAEN